MAAREERKAPQTSALVDIVAGTAGGIAIVFAGHPLDTLKVRLQTQPQDKPLYTGLVDCLRKTLKNEGVGGLYKGVASPLAGQAVFNAWQFMLYGQTIKALGGDGAQRLTIPQYFQAGLIVGAGVAFVESPQDLFKSQLQVQVFKEKPAFSTLSGCVKHIWREGGVRGVYQGLSATIVRNMLSVSLYFGVYESMRSHFAGPGGDVSKLPHSELLIAGGIGGLSYWAFNYPADVIKSAMQGDAIKRSERQYKGFVDAARQLYAQGGMPRFFRGYAPCMLRAFPANAACFFAYEKTKHMLS